MDTLFFFFLLLLYKTGVYFVPAFSGLYAPHWRDDARGVIVGLTRYANKSHIIRAALEAVCFQTKEVCDAMREDAKLSGVNLGNLKCLKVDGGMTVNKLLMEMQANILNCEVQRPKIVETTALGAAYVAGLAVGYFATTEEVSKQWQLDKSFKPDESKYGTQRRDEEFGRWKRAIGRTLHWTDEKDPSNAFGDNMFGDEKGAGRKGGGSSGGSSGGGSGSGGSISKEFLGGVLTGLAIVGLYVWWSKK